MPAVSKAQRALFGMAEHDPDEVYPENKGVLGMPKAKMHDFAATKEKGLPERVSKVKDLKAKEKDKKPFPFGGKK